MDPNKTAACYGPISKDEWAAIEKEIERQCEAMGLTALERYGASFNLLTGEIIPPPSTREENGR